MSSDYTDEERDYEITITLKLGDLLRFSNITRQAKRKTSQDIDRYKRNEAKHKYIQRNKEILKNLTRLETHINNILDDFDEGKYDDVKP